MFSPKKAVNGLAYILRRSTAAGTVPKATEVGNPRCAAHIILLLALDTGGDTISSVILN